MIADRPTSSPLASTAVPRRTPPKSRHVSGGPLAQIAHDLLRLAGRTVREVRHTVSFALLSGRLARQRQQIIDEYLASHTVRLLQLGSGPVVREGWLNTELKPRKPGQIYMNVTERFPFDDQTFDYIFAEHLIGDLSYGDTADMLKECFRVLSPGGRIRLSTPDLVRFLELCAPQRTAHQDQYLQWAVDNYVTWADAYLPGLIINNAFQELRFVYDEQTLIWLMRSAGFGQFTRHEPGESEDPRLKGIEAHGDVLGNVSVNRYESLIIEAVRPRSDAREH